VARVGRVGIVQTAQRIADEVLFPAALATDARPESLAALLATLETRGA
jgi:hypothetical protein